MTSRIPFIILCLLCLFAASPLSAATYLVENVARIKGQESTTISGWGIVSGLPGTGDDPKSYTPMAEAILKTLELGGMHIEPGRDRHRSVSSVRNSALVKVSVRIPATGAREGTMLDCTITSEGNAKSLKGGYLSTCFLKGPIPQPMEIAEPLGMADGQIRIEDAATPTVGKIKKGCRLLADFNNPYIEKGTMTLVIHPQFARGSLMARSLAQSINGFFEELGEGPRAKAVGLNYVMVRFPSSEFADPVQYVDQIMQIQVLLDREMVPTVVINEREGTITIGEGVEVKPSLIVTRNFIGEIRAPVPPGEREVNPNLFVDLDTETTRRQFEGEQIVNTKLKSLQAALDAVRATQEDMISIVKNLDEQGAIIGDVIYVE